MSGRQPNGLGTHRPAAVGQEATTFGSARPEAWSRIGLRLPAGLAFVEWDRIGDQLAGASSSLAWAVGDWWAYGDHSYGARAKAAAESRFKVGTLMNRGRVARAIETSRRREDLSFGHHECVANLPAEQQDFWLEQAATNRLSIKDFRNALKHAVVIPAGSDDAPPVCRSRADSQPGSIYELGPHRLLCGDATAPEQLTALLGQERAAMIWTDPSYGVDYVGKTKDALKIQNDGRDGLRELLLAAWQAAEPLLLESAPFYVAGPTGSNAEQFLASFREAGWHYQEQLVWVKNRMILGRCNYQQQHEGIYHGHAPGAPAGRWTTGRFRWYGADSAVTVFRVDAPSASREHPTMKPVALIIPQLLNSSQPGEIVLDPFAGSGGTMVAAHLIGRRAFMAEIDPHYCDVIRKRWPALSRTDDDRGKPRDET